MIAYGVREIIQIIKTLNAMTLNIKKAEHFFAQPSLFTCTTLLRATFPVQSGCSPKSALSTSKSPSS